MQSKDLASLTLHELIEIAADRSLLDGITVSGTKVRLDLDSEKIELREEAARVFLRGLIRGHEQAGHLNSS